MYILLLLAVPIGAFLLWLFLRPTVEEFPLPDDNIEIKSSSVHGKGVFAKTPFKPGDVIVSDVFKNRPSGMITIPPSKFNEYISTVGAHINHCSDSFNAHLVRRGADHSLVAIKNINVGDEITSNYDYVNAEFPFISASQAGYNKC